MNPLRSIATGSLTARNSPPITAMLAGTALVSLTFSTLAEDWSRFRGPNGSGVSDAKTIPAEVTKEVINWSLTVKGDGHSSPVVSGDKIFLTSVVADKNTRYVLCYSTGGKKLWEHATEFTPHSQHKFNNFASSTPAIDNSNVYISWTTGSKHQVIALTHDGEVAWEKDFGFFSEDHGSSSSPVVFKNTLLVSNDHAAEPGGYLMGLDTATGAARWKVDRIAARASFATPTIYTPENGKPQAIFSSNPMALTALDPETGELLWQFAGEYRKDIRTVASPVVAGGIVFASAGSGGGGKDSVAILPKGKDDKPELVWEMTSGLPYVPTPVALDDRFFLLGDNGTMKCVNATTGEQLWKERVTGESYSSPVCINGNLYCISREGKMAVVAASDTFQKISEYDFDSPVHASPAVAGDRLYVRTAKKLISIGKSGAGAAEPASENAP